MFCSTGPCIPFEWLIGGGLVALVAFFVIAWAFSSASTLLHRIIHSKDGNIVIAAIIFGITCLGVASLIANKDVPEPIIGIVVIFTSVWNAFLAVGKYTGFTRTIIILFVSIPVLILELIVSALIGVQFR